MSEGQQETMTTAEQGLADLIDSLDWEDCAESSGPGQVKVREPQ